MQNRWQFPISHVMICLKQALFCCDMVCLGECRVKIPKLRMFSSHNLHSTKGQLECNVISELLYTHHLLFYGNDGRKNELFLFLSC